MWGLLKWLWGLIPIIIGTVVAVLASRDRQAITEAWQKVSELGVRQSREQRQREAQKAKEADHNEQIRGHVDRAARAGEQYDRLQEEIDVQERQLRREVSDVERARRFNQRRERRIGTDDGYNEAIEDAFDTESTSHAPPGYPGSRLLGASPHLHRDGGGPGGGSDLSNGSGRSDGSLRGAGVSLPRSRDDGDGWD